MSEETLKDMKEKLTFVIMAVDEVLREVNNMMARDLEECDIADRRNSSA